MHTQPTSTSMCYSSIVIKTYILDIQVDDRLNAEDLETRKPEFELKCNRYDNY